MNHNLKHEKFSTDFKINKKKLNLTKKKEEDPKKKWEIKLKKKKN